MKLLQVGASLKHSGIASVMTSLAKAWEGASTFAVLESGHHEAFVPQGLSARRQVMRWWPQGVARQLEHWCRQQEVDAMLLHYPPLDRPALMAARRLGLKVAYYYHNSTPPKFTRPELRAKRIQEDHNMLSLLKQVDAVVCNSQYTAQKVLQQTGLQATVASPAVDLEHFKPLETSGEGLRLVHVGRAELHKGVVELLELLCPLLDTYRQVTLDHVGHVPDSEYGRRCRQLLDHPQIHWHRQADDTALAGLLGRAQLFVSASHFEGFGMPFLEAAACGTPSLGYRTAAIPEAVREGVSGWLVPDGDVEAFARKIRHLIESPQELQSLRQSSRSFAEERSWQQTAALIREALS